MCKLIIPQIPADANIQQKRQILFDALGSLDMNDKVEKRNGLSYLPWNVAWSELKAAFPDANTKVIRNPQTQLPYFSSNVGIMVFVELDLGDGGQKFEMYLPVMNSANRALKEEPYQIEVWNSEKRTWDTKTVPAATMTDINRTIQRATCKAIAIATGLGLYLYGSGDDLPEKESTSSTNGQQTPTQQPAPKPQKPFDKFAPIKDAINKANSVNDLMSLYLDHQTEIEGNPNVKALLTQRKQQLQLLNHN